jgi:hypothetical protein
LKSTNCCMFQALIGELLVWHLKGLTYIGADLILLKKTVLVENYIVKTW